MIYAVFKSIFGSGVLAVFKNISSRTLIAIMTAFFLSLIIGRPIINALYRHGFRSFERSYGEINSQEKTGTPMMGGILIFITGIGSSLLWCDLTNPFIWALLASAVWFAALGAFDDYQKIKGHDADKGLSRLGKIVMQVFFGILLAIFVLNPDISPLPADVADSLQVPFFKGLVSCPDWFIGLGIVFVVFAVSNSVNFADGMDGLTIVPSSFVFIVFGVFAYIVGNKAHASYLLYEFIPRSGEITVFCGAIVGAGLGFLWFNSHPAEVFMGDMGSLFLGGTMATAVVLIRQEIVFLIAGAVFVVEGFSTLIQEKIGFRMHRRILYRAPLHHHYQHQGMAETKIVTKFWIVSAIMAALALITIKFR